MKATTFIIWVLMLCITMGGALAAQPQLPTYTSAPILSIGYVRQPYFLANNPDKLHIHVYNSTGHLLTNVTTACVLHIYNNTGNHVVEDDMLFDTNGVDFFYSLPSTITSLIGIYPYIIHCQSNVEAGFVAAEFEIALLGVRDNSASSPFSALIVMPLLFGLLLLAGAFLFGEGHAVLKIFLFLFSYCMVFFSLWFGLQTMIRFYHLDAMQDIIGTFTLVAGVIFFVILSYFLIYAFIQAIEAAAHNKKKELEY